MRFIIYISFFILYIFFSGSCKKDFQNPYDNPDIKAPTDTTNATSIDPISFLGLHNNIFQPTCANSGCHDGAFDPDFRSIESSYNTLLYQEVIKNDTINTFTYRVLPGNAEMSVLYKRLIIDIDGQSGIMPLTAEYNPEHYWYDHKDEYISNIKTWIENGAKDVFGNDPVKGNREPQMQGLLATDNNNQTVARNGSKGNILLGSVSDTYTIWLSLSDDSTLISNLSINKIKYCTNINDFDNALEYDLSYNAIPVQDEGYFENNIAYYQSAPFPIDSFIGYSHVFVRVFIKDEHNDTTIIPANSSLNYIKNYFSLKMP